MSFNLSGAVITQSGTDTDLSGLASISGVTVVTQGFGPAQASYYNVGNNRLIIDGDLTFGANSLEKIIFGRSSPDKTVVINGSLTVGENVTQNGQFRAKYPDSGFVFTKHYRYHHDGFTIYNNTGTFNFYGSIYANVFAYRQIFESTQFVARNAFISVQHQASVSGGLNGLIRFSEGTVDVDTLFFTGPSTLARENATIIQLKNVRTQNSGGIAQIETSGGTFVLNGYNPLASTYDIGYANGVPSIFAKNSSSGTNLYCASEGGVNYPQAGIVEILQDILLSVSDGTNPIQGAKLYIKDNNNGERGAADNSTTPIRDLNFLSRFDNAPLGNDRVYTASSDLSGSFGVLTLLTGVVAQYQATTAKGYDNLQSRVDRRTISDTKGSRDNPSDFKVNFISYNKSIFSVIFDIAFNGVYENSIILTDDLEITETTKATVDAYTDLGTAQKIYDAYKSELVGNYTGQTTTILGRVGNQIDLDQTATSLIIDATAVSVRDLTGTTATVKASTYTGGAITTASGTVTTRNGALLNGGTFDCNVNYESGASTTLTNVTVNGILDFDTAGTYNLNSCKISEVTNSSAGNITINLLNGSTVTTNTGPNITLLLPPIDVTFTDLQTGSQVVVYVTGTTTEKFRTENSGTSVQWTEVYTADINYDVTIQKAGFFPIRFTNLTASTIPITTSINQLIDRAYQASSGLTYSTNANVNTTTKEFSVSVDTTVQNYYSFWIEQWIDNTALRNIEFPISTFGGNSFSFDQGYEFTSSSLQYLSRDGFRYFDSGNVTARYAAILSQGVSTGLQAEYQQAQGGNILDTQNTGNVDQVIQIYGDSTHGNFDYTDYLVFKVQANGFRQAEANIVSVFGTLEEQFYVTSLNTLAIPNFTIGNPNVTGLSITDDSASPVSWDAGDGTARNYSLTITDTNNNTGENILRWLNYNLSLDATFEGKDPFYYPEMIIDNGSSYETIRGILYRSTSNVLAGIRVIDNNGNPHRDFIRFQSDDGSYGVPVEIKTVFITGITTGSRLKIFNITTGLTIFNGFINATTYTEEYTEGNNYSQGNQLEITLTYQIGTTAKIPLISQAIVGATGWSLLVNQKDLTAYSSLGADGSTVTEYNIDSNTGNLEIDANDTDCFSSKRRLVARYYYLITTEEGINRYVNAIVLEDEANAIIDRTITNLTVDNTGNCTLNLTDSDFRLYTSDGSSWIKNPPTGGFGIISDSGKVYIKGQEQLENKVQKLVDSENADIFVEPTRFTKKIKGTDTVILEKTYSTDEQGTESLTEVT